jgi:hypothetical protein
MIRQPVLRQEAKTVRSAETGWVLRPTTREKCVRMRCGSENQRVS